MSTATYPGSTPSYGQIPDEHLHVERIARDVEAMAATLIADDASLMDAGTALTGGAATLAANHYYLAATLGSSSTCTLPAATTANARIHVLRTDTHAYTIALGSVFTMPASTAGHVTLRADGTNWRVEAVELGNKVVYSDGTGTCKVVAPSGGATITLVGNLTTTGGNATLAVPAAGGTVTIGGNLTTTGAYTTSLTQAANTVLALPSVSSNLVGSTTGVLSAVAPAGGATLNLAGNLTTTGAYNTSFTQAASTTLALPSVSSTLARTVEPLVAGSAVSFGTAATTVSVDPSSSRTVCAVGALNDNSTIVLGHTNAANGWEINFTCAAPGAYSLRVCDGAAGTPITGSSTASKRWLARAVYDGTVWVGSMASEP